MKIAYADPPYIGKAKKHYGCEEVDHAALIEKLGGYDGWALSLNSTTLREVLPMCPDRVRVMAWVKSYCCYKKGVPLTYAWEPVIVKPARKQPRQGTFALFDWVQCAPAMNGFVGAKPEPFCFWLFEVLGCRSDDNFDDLFTGSGAVSRAWEAWTRQGLLFEAATP